MLEGIVNADLTQRVVVATDRLPWLPSSRARVRRRVLDRVGSAIARETSIVRYAPGSTIPAHEHGLELFVVNGVLSDERNDYGGGTYVRNPPRTCHASWTARGCTVLAKSLRFEPTKAKPIIIDSNKVVWKLVDLNGLTRLSLYLSSSSDESVALERLPPQAQLIDADRPGGEEIFVLTGEIWDRHGSYGAGTWIRTPAGCRSGFGSLRGATYWAKRGHLRVAS